MQPSKGRKFKMSSIGYVLDANVIYSSTLREIFVTMGKMGLPIFWTSSIADEFISARDRKVTGAGAKARVTLDQMELAIPDWEIVPTSQPTVSPSLPDPDDLHVVYAATAVGQGAVIVTQNLADFPASALEPLGISARSADAVLCELLESEPDLVTDAALEVLSRLKNPPVLLPEWLRWLKNVGCPKAATMLKSLLAP